MTTALLQLVLTARQHARTHAESKKVSGKLAKKKQTSSWAYKKSFSKPQIQPVRGGIGRAWTLVLG